MLLKRLYTDPTDLMDLEVGTLKGLSISPPKEVNQPTYEIVGPVERYDQRDLATIRLTLKPGSPQYEEYYSRHPEKKDADDETRCVIAESVKKLAHRNHENLLNRLVAEAGFLGTTAVSRPDLVEARLRRPNVRDSLSEGERVEADPALITSKIKALALYLGTGKVRITEIKPEWVYTYQRDGQPVKLDYKYIICMAFPQDPFMQESKMGNAVSLEIGWRYSFAAYVSLIVANYIRELGWPARSLPSGNSPYLVVPTFVDAGIGEQGRCGYVVTKEFGNNWRPSAVATDMPLVIDKPVDFGLQYFCEKCSICAEKCPSGAIPKGGREIVRGVQKWQADTEKCHLRRQKSGVACDICQLVCPWNHANNFIFNGLREIAQNMPGLRSALIRAESFFYPRKKARPQPKWLRDGRDGYKIVSITRPEMPVKEEKPKELECSTLPANTQRAHKA